MIDFFKLAESFCVNIVSDDVLNCSELTDKELFKSLLIERNSHELCGWPKCCNIIDFNQDDMTEPIFCSLKCNNLYHRFLQNKGEDEVQKENIDDGTVGLIVERNVDQRPPRKINNYFPYTIENNICRIGPYRYILDEISRWVSSKPVSPKNPLTDKQKSLFEYVNSVLEDIDIKLNHTLGVFHFFVNLDVKNLDLFYEQDDVFKQVFSYCMFEIMTGQDMSSHIEKLSFSFNIYKDILIMLDKIPAQEDVE